MRDVHLANQDVSVDELQAMAKRQQKQIEAQQQMLVAKEQRLKYLRQQDFKQQQMNAEYERLRRLREKVEAQELKLRKLRALRGQQQQKHQGNEMGMSNSAVLADLESIRSLFNEKEKELGSAVRKVEDLTRQLDDLRSTNTSSVNGQTMQNQVIELERLRRELAYRRQLNEQQNNMIAQQRAQLAMGRDEITKIDNRIIELQERLARKRLMNQQLATKISAATSAKQAQLRAIQQGITNKPNKPISTVEPFMRRQSKSEDDENDNIDKKYQTLPFGKSNKGSLDESNKTSNNSNTPINNVPPVTKPSRPSQLLRENSALGLMSKTNNESNTGSAVSKPALPPKPSIVHTSKTVLNNTPNNQYNQPPPYVPAPQPTELATVNISKASEERPTTLSVSLAPDQGTSVDDDEDVEENSKGTVNISINRRIEMPPAFLFPENQAPPSDLISPRDETSNEKIVIEGANDNKLSFEMLKELYTEFDHLSYEEKSRLLSAGQGLEAESIDEMSSASSDQDEFIVPEVIEEETQRAKQAKPIIKNLERQRVSSNNVRFDPLALLLDASLEGELELVQQTAHLVPDASEANDEGITALHNAICAGHLDIVYFLVNFGCNVNAQDSDGWTPLHCAASCNNLPMAKFLVEHGACIYSTTFSDSETAAEKCEEDEEGFAGCSEYLYNIQDTLGTTDYVYAVFDFDAKLDDELSLRLNDELTVLRRGDDAEKQWWWVKKNKDNKEGYVPRNHLGSSPRILPQQMRPNDEN